MYTPCSAVLWRVLATHSIRQSPFHFPSHATPCAITFKLESTAPLGSTKRRLYRCIQFLLCIVGFLRLNHVMYWNSSKFSTQILAAIFRFNEKIYSRRKITGDIHFVNSPIYICIVYAIGMSRMWRFLAILRRFFVSPLLHTFSTNYSSILSHLILPSISWSTIHSFIN